YINEYLEEYSNNLDSRLEEKLLVLEESKKELDNILNSSFENLNSRIEESLSKVNSLAEEKLISIEKDINDKLLVNVEKLSKLEEDFGKLFNKDYVEELDSRINSINSKLEEEISNIRNSLDNDIYSVRSQYKELSVDFEEALDLVKKSILDRDEVIDLQSKEKDELISQLESLRDDYLSLKGDVSSVSDNNELYSLFEEEREKLERG
ncbi:hypothetical protein E6A47_10660, partial [Brachyspira pilosicoli]|uniref:hypothetical protein n=1 Tax=Brachyspira pilosicoli TaxID=52584 RepID=UPI001CA57A7C